MMRFIVFCVFLSASACAASPPGQAHLNQWRAATNQAPVRYSDRLQRMAAAHADDMARNGFISHTGSNGAGLTRRARAQGYDFCYVSENLARGQETVAEVMQDWADSRSHRRNMMNPRAVEYGFARAPGDNWVLVLGQPGC